MKIKRQMEVTVYICDLCRKETVGAAWHTCIMCERDICDDCLKDDFSYHGYVIHLCSECHNKATLKEVAKKAREVYGIRA